MWKSWQGWLDQPAYHVVMVANLHHLLIAVLAAATVAGCSADQQVPAMDADGTPFHLTNTAVGVWETAGSVRSDTPCSWTRSTATPATFDNLIDVGRSEGATRVSVQDGDWFVSYGCMPWHHVA